MAEGGLPPLTPAQRRLRAQLASLTRWGRTPDRSAATQPARDRFDARFAREVDEEFPPGSVSADQRDAMIAARRSAYFKRLALMRSRAGSRGGRR